MKPIPRIKMRAKQFRASVWRSDTIFFKCIKPAYKITRFIYYFILNKSYRHDRLTEFRYKRETIQPNSFTSLNRYPDLFKILQQHFARKSSVRILSFGCSSGAEVFSLSECLTSAQITGIDINNYCLRQANRQNKNSNLCFYHVLSEEYSALTDFDAILCLAVLQHSNNRENIHIAKKFTFNIFEQQITALDKKLKSGGLLIIDHCDFNFSDTKIAKEYTALPVDNNQILRQRPTFNKFNQRISNTTNYNRIWLKQK